MSQLKTARDIKLGLPDLDKTAIPNWPRSLVGEAFLRVREERFLFEQSRPDFPRRIPWLYVENGCFLKAALIRRKFEEYEYPPISKLFAFGNMQFDSELGTDEKITYKDHVVAAARCENEIYVFDHSININEPMKFTDWAEFLSADGHPDSLEYSICSRYTLGHNSPAFAKTEIEEVGYRNCELKSVDFFAQDFLKKEWEQVKKLQMDPFRVLGCEPTWKLKK